MEKYNYVILGGGISGITFARLLQLHTNKTFIVLEKESEIGGLCRTHNVDGNHLDIGGGHFLYSKQKEVYDFIFSHIPESEFNKVDRVTKIAIENRDIDYPIENNLWQLPEDIALRYLDSMIDGQINGKPGFSLKEWAYKFLGKEICENYFIPYNEKIWGLDIDKLSADWIYKIPKPDLRKIISDFIKKKDSKESIPSHSYFYYPKTGGFSRIVDSIYEKVRDHVIVNEKVESMAFDELNREWIINNKYQGKIINTVPWPALPLYLTDTTRSCFVSNSIAVSFERASNPVGWHWKYEPGSVSHHREFYVNSYATKNPILLFARETNLKRWTDYKPYYSHINEFAYPVPTYDTLNFKRQFIVKMENNNCFGLGRWGTWQYHNSDICMRQAMDLLNKLEKTNL